MRTSPPTTTAASKRPSPSGICAPPARRAPLGAGFTLIELLVVVAVITVITVFALPSVSSYFEVSLDSAARQMASTVKETYNTTSVTGKVHRLVYDIKNGQYWVEEGPPGILLDTDKSREREARRKRFGGSLFDKPPPSPFSMDTTITRKKVSLPMGVSFEDIVTQQSKDPITDGKAYTHFFPAGLTEQTIIHLKDTSSHHSSLVLTPLIGRTDLYGRYISSEEIFGK